MKHQPTQQRQSECGVAMIVALFAILVIGLSAAGALTLLEQEMRAGKMVLARAQARAAANGGVERVIVWLTQNTGATGGAPTSVTTGNLGNGSYTVTVNDKGNLILEIVSTGTAGGVAVTSRAYLLSPGNGDAALSTAIFTQSNLTVSGHATVTGDLWTNHDLTVYGHIDVTGTGYYVGHINKWWSKWLPWDFTSQHVTTPLAFPTVDSDYLYKTAAADYEVYNFNGSKYTYVLGPNAGKKKTGTTFNPAHGVVWLNATDRTLELSGDKGTLTVNNGSIVIKNATSLRVSGQDTITVSPPLNSSGGSWPGLIMLDGSVIFSGHATFDGGGVYGIYLRSGGITISGHADFRGNIVSYGGVNITGEGEVAVDSQGRTVNLSGVGGTGGLYEMLVWER